MPDTLPPRRPSIATDDVVVLRTGGSSPVYQLHVHGMGPTPERFASFELAAVKGDEIAKKNRVTLFYIDSPNDPPFALRDYRR